MAATYVTGLVAILLFLATQLIVDPIKSRKARKKELIKNKLEKLYSPIYSEVFMIQAKLIAEIKTTVHVIAENEAPYRFDEPIIEGPFNSIIKPVSEIVLKNIHLLDDKDMKLWEKFEETANDLEDAMNAHKGREGDGQLLLTKMYKCFKNFIDSSVESYHIYREEYSKS